MAVRLPRTSRRAIAYAGLIVLTLVFVTPLLWMALSSLKPDAEVTATPVSVLPHQATTAAYSRIFDGSSQTPVIRWFFNSVIAGLCHTLVVVATAAPAAYALARLEFRGRRLAFGAILATLFIPPVILLAPNYLIVSQLGWLDSLPAVIFPLAGSAFGVFFMRQFFLGLPRELEEAAVLDGANAWQVFWRIVLPNSRSALVTLALLSLLTNWNDFLWPVFVLFNPAHLTLAPGLALLQNAQTTHYAVIMAGGVLAIVPILVIFLFAQRYIIEGVARSGIKG
jgi:multiple sugar transport system permease protein